MHAPDHSFQMILCVITKAFGLSYLEQYEMRSNVLGNIFSDNIKSPRKVAHVVGKK